MTRQPTSRSKAIYHWLAAGQIPQGDIGVDYIVANTVRPVQKLRNRRMRGTSRNEHEDKGEAVQHMIDFQTAKFHRYHPEYRWPKDFVADMYWQGEITARGITYREALRRMGRDAEAASTATMDQGRDQYGLSDEKAIEFGAGFLSRFENAVKFGVPTFEALIAAKSEQRGLYERHRQDHQGPGSRGDFRHRLHAPPGDQGPQRRSSR